jgi:triosephosphate isomerase
MVPQNIADIGAKGSLINHSEHRMQIADIEELINLCKEEKLFSLVCANNAKTSLAIASLQPDAIAMEPPELIGSGISVSTKPDIVDETVKLVKNNYPDVHVIVGAGISSSADIKDSLRLRAEGVLLASGFVKAKDPELKLKEMAEAIIK